jgi:glycosyltransferase involved in cell wall biosynthesis
VKILHVLPTLDPKAGGPLEGVRQRGLRLGQMGHFVEVVTLDDQREPFVAEFPLKVHALGPSSGGYRYNSSLSAWLRRNARNYDAVIVNGLWQYSGFGTWRALRGAGVPYFVFTHGMLDPWFKYKYPFKHFKKWLYWPWAEYRVLRDARAVLFTSEEERIAARRSFWLYRANEKVVAYGTNSPPTDAVLLREQFFAAHPELRGRRLVLFLGRIHEKKGCNLLIEAFSRVASADPLLHVIFVGPDKMGYEATLKSLALKQGVADRVSWLGMLQGSAKWAAFYASEIFVLPSHQENFGIAVAEALACALPVLISNKVNIWREIEQREAGYVGADSIEGTESNLRRWLALSDEARAQMRLRAESTFRQLFTIDAMCTSLLDVIKLSNE